jgi:hypothetical protein
MLAVIPAGFPELYASKTIPIIKYYSKIFVVFPR